MFFYPQVIENVGAQFEVRILDLFIQCWISLFVQSSYGRRKQDIPCVPTVLPDGTATSFTLLFFDDWDSLDLAIGTRCSCGCGSPFCKGYLKRRRWLTIDISLVRASLLFCTNNGSWTLSHFPSSCSWYCWWPANGKRKNLHTICSLSFSIEIHYTILQYSPMQVDHLNPTAVSLEEFRNGSFRDNGNMIANLAVGHPASRTSDFSIIRVCTRRLCGGFCHDCLTTPFVRSVNLTNFLQQSDIFYGHTVICD